MLFADLLSLHLVTFLMFFIFVNNEKLGAAPQKHAGGDAKQAIKFARPRKALIGNWSAISGCVS